MEYTDATVEVVEPSCATDEERAIAEQERLREEQWKAIEEGE